MRKEPHKLTPVSILLWIVATGLLLFFGSQLLRMWMGHTANIIRWLQVGAMTLGGLILLALASILDRLSQIVLHLQNHNTITEDHTRWSIEAPRK
jgi:ABC-type proline/glycine betaine transport system permease subunit